jgi:hypothetical protein
VRLKKARQNQGAKPQKYLPLHPQSMRKRLQRRANALLQFRSQFFKQQKQLMRQLKRHVAPRQRAVKRKLQQKIQLQQ